jgi:hypothetical protein
VQSGLNVPAPLETENKIGGKEKMSTPVLGRNARLLKAGQPIGYGKNISIKAAAEMIKDYSMDSLTPAVSGVGKQSFTWTMERLYTDGANMTLLLAGTQFDLIFAPTGTPLGTNYETWTNCTILSCERTAGESGGLLEKISGEAEGVTVSPP